jgi:hypothetical protein
MSDLKLSDGREVTIDLHQITMREFRDWFFNPQVEDESSDAYMGKVTGLEDCGDINPVDYRAILNKTFAKYQNPISDPNSSSESNSTAQENQKTSPTD